MTKDELLDILFGAMPKATLINVDPLKPVIDDKLFRAERLVMRQYSLPVIMEPRLIVTMGLISDGFGSVGDSALAMSYALRELAISLEHVGNETKQLRTIKSFCAVKGFRLNKDALYTKGSGAGGSSHDRRRRRRAQARFGARVVYELKNDRTGRYFVGWDQGVIS